MSLNMYFKKEIRQAEGFKSEPYPDGSGDKMSIMGMNLFNAGDLLYSIQGENGTVPTELEKYVVNISMYARISAKLATRETGIYRHEGAEAEVELDLGNKNPEYQIKINGKEMKRIHELLRMIKSGSIRPEESYEAPQSGKSRQQLEQMVKQLEATIKNLRMASEIQEKLFNQLHEQLSWKILRLANSLENEPWPFCTKRGVGHQFKAILDSK